MRSAVIVNPNAGALRRNPALAESLKRLCGSDAVVCVTRDDGVLKTTAEELAREGVRHVAIVGGDGTASTTLTRLWQAYGDDDLPSISLLRGGTMNTIANSLGVSRRNPAWLLRGSLAAWSRDAARSAHLRPTLRIGDRLGFLFGTGIWYGYLAEYYAAGSGHPTPITAATVLARAAASSLVGGPLFERVKQARTLSVRFAEGAWEPRVFLTVGAGTVAHAGLGFRPFHRAFERDDRFQLLGVENHPSAVVRDLPRVWFGRSMRHDAAQDVSTTWAELSCREGAFGYSVDGDLLEASGTLSLSLGPRFDILRI